MRAKHYLNSKKSSKEDRLIAVFSAIVIFVIIVLATHINGL
jgi:hypothetical protein